MKRKFKALLFYLKGRKIQSANFSWSCYEGENPQWEWGYDDVDNIPKNIKDIAVEITEMFWQKVYDEAPGSDSEYYRIELTIYPFENRAEIGCDYEVYKEESGSYSDDIKDEEFVEMFNRKKIKQITANYNGSGDSGEINQIQIDGEDMNIDRTTNQDEKLIDGTLYEYLERAFSGWEIDDGSRGEITIYKPYDETIVIDISHSWKLKEMEESEYKKEITENDFE
jgi:hypothetical protein